MLYHIYTHALGISMDIIPEGQRKANHTVCMLTMAEACFHTKLPPPNRCEYN